ncbi:MAG: hypothetical protein ACEY3I_01215 [Arsenophonus sp.]
MKFSNNIEVIFLLIFIIEDIYLMKEFLLFSFTRCIY